MKKVIQILIALMFSGIMLIIFSCSDSTGPAADSVVYENIVKSSAEQQVLTTKENLRIIIPGGAVEGNMELKITKIGNPPKYEGNSFQVGNNIFKVSVGGSFDLKNAIEFRIKYDKSKLKDGAKPLDFFLGLKYVASQWSKADYTIDLSTEEIVIKYNKPSGSIKSKSQETLQSDDDIIIGDGMVLDKGEMLECNACNFEVNYNELEKKETEREIYFVKKGTSIYHGPYMSWYDAEKKNKLMCGCNKNGKGEGNLTKWYENGNIMEEGTLKDDKRFGFWTVWEESGKKIEEGTYKIMDNGYDKDGIWNYWSWWPNGNILLEYSKLHSNGYSKLEGKHNAWYENGNKDFEGSFKDDNMDGICRWWYENGKIKKWANFINKLPEEEIEWLYWESNWNIKWEYSYTSFFNNDGKPERCRHGKLTGWYEKGAKHLEEYYKYGKLDGLSTSWYENGNKGREGNYKEDKKVGLWTEWREDGTKSSEGSFKENKEDGLWTEWHKNGNKSSVGNFKDGKRIGVWWYYKLDGSCNYGEDYGDGSGSKKSVKCP